ncbi:MAG: Asp23/Gls24 family envelope stress response protein [Clostridia bacterium]|nr:Asp23/Gls24 family envelope stress response protein [Clostridia bacterium]
MSEIKGSHIISDEVIAAITLNAAQEIEEIAFPAGITHGIAERFGKKQWARGIKVEQNNEGVTIEIKVVIKYGVHIPEVCSRIQEKVKEQVEKLTGLKVIAVDINVTGLEVPDQPQQKEK